jgi:hypothetical protein
VAEGAGAAALDLTTVDMVVGLTEVAGLKAADVVTGALEGAVDDETLELIGAAVEATTLDTGLEELPEPEPLTVKSMQDS